MSRIVLHQHGAWKAFQATWPVRKSEWVMAFAVVVMWIVLAFNEELFTRPGYAHLAELAPQWVWQWFCFIVGFGRVGVLVVNGSDWRTPYGRAFFAFLSCFLWWHIGAGFAANVGLGMVLAAAVFFTDVFNCKQAVTEAAASQSVNDAGRKHLSRARY